MKVEVRREKAGIRIYQRVNCQFVSIRYDFSMNIAKRQNVCKTGQYSPIQCNDSYLFVLIEFEEAKPVGFMLDLVMMAGRLSSGFISWSTASSSSPMQLLSSDSSRRMID